MSLTIETELKDIFTKIDQRLDRMEQGINDLKLGQSEIKGDIKALDENSVVKSILSIPKSMGYPRELVTKSFYRERSLAD